MLYFPSFFLSGSPHPLFVSLPHFAALPGKEARTIYKNSVTQQEALPRLEDFFPSVVFLFLHLKTPSVSAFLSRAFRVPENTLRAERDMGTGMRIGRGNGTWERDM